MTFMKIFCPTDFSSGAAAALRVAARMAGARAELVVAHAWDLPRMAYPIEAAFPPRTMQEIVDDAQRRVEAAVRDAQTAGATRVTGRLLGGVPWLEIVGQLEADGFDLCVIGTHGRSGLSRVLLGSVAEKVVRHAPCSVLAIRPDTDAGPFRHVLVPTDFSESAEHALALAPALVDPDGELSLLHVIEVPMFLGERTMEDYALALDRDASGALDAAAARMRAICSARVSTKAWPGAPGTQILSAVDADRSIDLVVVGSHGRTGIRRVLMGSVAEKVVRHARCPVLVARKRR